jgi:hypothetical protein
MGHHISSIIGNETLLAPFASRFASEAPVMLNGGLVLVPLEGFASLAAGGAAEIAAALGRGPALYVETDEMGGLGAQAAALIEQGGVAWQRARLGCASGAPRAWTWRILHALRASRWPTPIGEGMAKLRARLYAQEQGAPGAEAGRGAGG